MIEGDDDAEIKALRWRCRRGMRELDQLLLRWLDRCWGDASEPERGQFRRLLLVEDDKLWRAFLGQDALADVELERLIQRVLALPH